MVSEIIKSTFITLVKFDSNVFHSIVKGILNSIRFRYKESHSKFRNIIKNQCILVLGISQMQDPGVARLIQGDSKC